MPTPLRRHRLFGLILITIAAAACSLHTVPSVPEAASLSRSEVISRYFEGRSLDPVEGIWIWDNNSYEVAIVRNRFDIAPEYDYIAIVTDSRRSTWSRGEVKMLLKGTVSASVLTGIYYMGNKSEQGTSVLMANPNVLEMRLPTGAYGSMETTLLMRAYPSDVRAAQGQARSGGSSGTGFLVSPSTVVTNYHVIAEGTQITVDLAGVSHAAEVVLQDRNNDLAVLRVAQSLSATGHGTANCLPLGNAELVRAGDRVYTLGFPLSGLLGSRMSVGEGLVNSTVGIQDDPRLFQISIPVQPGNSGGPLLDRRGQVVGIVTSTLNNRYLFERTGALPQNVNFAVKVSYLRNILSLVPHTECGAHAFSQDAEPREMQERFANAVVRIQAR
jgi:S1-C subfamily serine protease